MEMDTLMKPLQGMLDKALKEAESFIENQQFLSNLVDRAFVKMGQGAEALYDIQDQFLALMRMVRAWARREYTEVSPKALISLVAALIYFVNPLDVISDFIPFIGLIDDIAIITYIIGVFNKEIERFMEWERNEASHNIYEQRDFAEEVA